MIQEMFGKNGNTHHSELSNFKASKEVTLQHFFDASEEG